MKSTLIHRPASLSSLSPFGGFPRISLLLLTLLPGAAAASTCSYGENFDFSSTTSGGVSHIGTMTNLDIDRQTATVTVTNGNGGNLPAGVTGAQGGPGVDFSSYEPALSNSSSPAYGRGLALTGSQGVPITFTFSKEMRNLVMHIRNGDNQLFTFTDGAGNPLEVSYHFVPVFGTIPQSGTGASSAFFLRTASNQLAVGETAVGTIAFKNPVTVVKMTQTYIGNTRPDLTPATLNSTSSFYQVNFGQYCDQAGVVDQCNNINFAQWETYTNGVSPSPDVYSGRLIDETGKAITVTHTASVLQSTTAATASFDNGAGGATAGIFILPRRPGSDLVLAQDTATSGNPVTFTWTFGEIVKNPSLMLVSGSPGAPVNLRFYKADGITPLPFLLRAPNSPSVNRQVDANTLYALSSCSSTIQFIGETTAIVLKGTRVTPVDFTLNIQSTVFLGCDGTMTASGSAIDGDSDGDSVPDLTDKCPGTPVGATVGADGCPLPTDLSITKSASVTKITPGVPFNYTITVTNTGAQATNVKASDVVPAGLTINSVSASDSGVVTQNGQSVEAAWAIVPDSGVRTLTINVTKP